MMMVLITLAYDKGSDKPACTHDLARTFTALRKSMQVEEDSKPSGHSRMGDYMRLLQKCDKTKSRICMHFSHNPDI